MNDYKAWVEDARVKLAQAKECLDRWPADAFQKALESAEFLLKAVLERAGKFVLDDYIHKLHPLMDKIDRERCLPPETIIKARKILTEFGRIDVGGPRSDPTHVNSIDYTPDVRYPKGGKPSTERISKEVAKRKIDLSRQLYDLLVPYLG